MLLLLQVGETSSLGVNVLHLARAVGVKLGNLLARGVVAGLFKVGADAGEEAVGALRDAVAGVGGLGAVGRVVLLVDVLDGAEEAVGHVVLGVQLDGAFDGGVANDVSVSEILGEDASAGLLLLRDVVRVAVHLGVVVALIICGAAGAGDGDVVRSKLGVVEEEGRLHGRFLLKGDVGGLGVALGSDFEVGNLATANVVSQFIAIQTASGVGWMVQEAYQKLKKFLTSSSLVADAIFVTWTVAAAMVLPRYHRSLGSCAIYG